MTVRALADEQLDIICHADPLEATMFGLPGFDHLLDDLSEAGQATLRDRQAGIVAKAAAIDSSTLDNEDAVTRSVIEQQARARIDQIDSRWLEFNITGLFVSPASGLLSMLPMIAFPDADRARAYVERLNAIPTYLADMAERHRAGVAAGRIPVRRLVQGAIDYLDHYLGTDLAADPLLRQAFPAGGNSLVGERERVVAERVRPAYAAYRDALASEIIEHGRPDEKAGVCWLPGGDTIYSRLSKMHLTIERDAEELHQVGLDLAARLAEEYAEVGAKVFGISDRAEIFKRMSTDPELRWSGAEELLAAANRAVRRAEEAAPDWFGLLPSKPCKVEPVPEADAPHSPTAFYIWPSVDGSRDGVYFANTYHAEQRDRFTSEVIAFHEAVPGHHLQLSVSQELSHLPLVRRIAAVNVYAEGWGLYTERLADEMGLYSGELDRLGMLAMDSLRAGRLVVDTGLHAKGWSRAQAIGYLKENTPLSELEITNEVDRYIAYPGQALSYMVGRLEIQRLRAKAESALGSRFDIKSFHDVVLGNGSLPLGVLDEVVTGWITSR
jgi:uncharacterized protein (DUF885 family)